jgi:preprotein translocase SecF subunit
MIDFLKYRVHCLVFSCILALAAAGTYWYKVHTTGHAFTYSIDFTGGTQVLLKTASPVSPSKIKEILETAGWHGATVRTFSNEHELEVRVKEYANDSKGLAERIKQVISEHIETNSIDILQSEAVGAGIGAGLRWKSARAVIFACFAILAYVAWSFWSFAFAVGGVVALIHDAFIMLFVFLLLGREISVNVIAAILTVLGYSINDTIVIFAQIRSDLKSKKGQPLYDLVNNSINHTLRRTLLTSFSTALTVISLLVLGGEVLRDFALALLVGIIFGTYSSIYMASPIMMLLYKEKK